MTVKLKKGNQVVDAMFFDGSADLATGLTVWAGSNGATVQQRWVGGDNAHFELELPDGRRIAPGYWLIQKKDGSYDVLTDEEERTQWERTAG